MTTRRPTLEEKWTAAFLLITTLASAALIALPALRALRALPAAKVAIYVMTLGMIGVFIRRESSKRILRMIMKQIYAEAQLGRKMAPPVIEFLATVVWTWATLATL